MKIHLLRSPLDPNFEKERKILLIVSTVGIAVVWANFLPEGFEILGIKTGGLDPEGFARMLALITLYFLISFCAHAVMDWKSWEWKLKTDSSVKNYDTLSELKKERSSKSKLPISIEAFFTNKIIFTKVLFDLLLPPVVGVYAFSELVRWNSPPAQIVSILPKDNDPGTKSSIVFVNPGLTFFTKKNDE